jgi:tRNA modification GTPase
LKEERAIVSEIAGTTRDTIEEILHIKGNAFRLIDTAGLRETEDTIEAIGVVKAKEKVARIFWFTLLMPIQKTYQKM